MSNASGPGGREPGRRRGWLSRLGPKPFGWRQRPVTWRGYLLVIVAVLACVVIITVGHRQGWNPVLIGVVPLIVLIGVTVFIRR